jgi:translation elongation factor EF-1alpha
MEKRVGIITHYFGKIGVAVMKIESDSVKIGDTIHIKGTHTDFTQTVDSMQVEHKSVETAKTGDEVGIKVTDQVHEKDEIYLVTE